MNYDRIADIPIHHHFVHYVCTIGYSERRNYFELISARYANPNRKDKPKDGENLYRYIMIKPALRANLLEALTPNNNKIILELREKAIDERSLDYGFIAGLLAIFLLVYALYNSTSLLAQVFSFSTAATITLISIFLSFFIMSPVTRFVSRAYKRRYCGQHNHQTESFKNKDKVEMIWCDRCGLAFGTKSALDASAPITNSN